MIPSRLYDLAFQFRQTKLWKKLYDSQMFAIQHEDGSIGYCCVMGLLGEHLALAVYPGDEGLAAYRLMCRDRSAMRFTETHEAMLSQNCAMVSFESKGQLPPKEMEAVRAYCTSRGLVLRGKNAYPQFQRFRPQYMPWYLDDPDDQARLAQALEAALDVSEKLLASTPEAMGFTFGAPYDRTIPFLKKRRDAFIWSEMDLPAPKPAAYPCPEDLDDLAVARLSKAVKRGGEWACDIFMHCEPVSGEASGNGFVHDPKSAPFFPFLLLILDNKSGMVLSVQLQSLEEPYADGFMRTVLDIAQKGGKPTRILVCNDRTHAFFAKPAAQMGAKLVMKRSIPSLEETELAFFERYDSDKEDSADQIDQLVEMLRDPLTLEQIPDEILIHLSQTAEMDALPADISARVLRECRKRGI